MNTINILEIHCIFCYCLFRSLYRVTHIAYMYWCDVCAVTTLLSQGHDTAYFLCTIENILNGIAVNEVCRRTSFKCIM